MKKIAIFPLLLLFISASLTECKKNTDGNKSPVDSTGAVGYTGYMPSINGMKLTYTITEGDEKGNTSILTVTGLKDSSGYTAARFSNQVAGMTITSNGAFNKSNTILTSTVPPIYYSMLDSLKKVFNVNFTHQEQPFVMTIPHQNQAGASVFDDITTGQIHGEMYDSQSNEHTTEDYFLHMHDGVIDSVATINTVKGKIPNCVRVHYIMTSAFSYVVTDDSGTYSHSEKTSLDESQWFAPGLGLIQSKETNQSGDVTVTELTGVQ